MALIGEEIASQRRGGRGERERPRIFILPFAPQTLSAFTMLRRDKAGFAEGQAQRNTDDSIDFSSVQAFSSSVRGDGKTS